MQSNSKVWFVTGASKGFGLALVKLLLSSGHKVAATSRNAQELERKAGGIVSCAQKKDGNWFRENGWSYFPAVTL